jgi:gamma-glutamyltranspeptidase/glutathione hydrolase
MVSSGHYLAAAAGYRILEQGGNAVDAGVASGIAINVTLPHMTSFGGVAPIIIYLAEADEVVTISGLGRWPKSVSLQLFRDTYGEIPRGIPRSVVPSACDAWLTALELYGTMSFEQVVTPALELTEAGFPISHRLAAAIAGSETEFGTSPESMAAFMPEGKPPVVGDPLKRAGLGKVFRWMIDAERGAASGGRERGLRAARDLFYKGEVAERMVDFCQAEGGYLTMEDFADFHVKVEPPETVPYKDYQVYTCGPWCQGPSLLQVLNILEGVDLADLGHNSAEYVHTAVEAVKLAFADRDAYYGDPDFVEVPMDVLLSKEYAAVRREMIDPNKAWPEMPPAGDTGIQTASVGTRSSDAGPWEGDTSYTCVVDRWGNAFSATPSDGELGAPLVPEIGMAISGRGSQNWLDPEHPSSLAPWKRPRLTPNPAMALRDGKLFMPFGTPGGDAQVQSMAQLFLNVVEFGMDPQQAIEAPRFTSMSFPNSFWPHAYRPGELAIESRVGDDVMSGLTDRGHKIEQWADWEALTGGMCAIKVDRERGALFAGADPRRESYAIGR